MRDKAKHAAAKRRWQVAHMDYYRRLAKEGRERMEAVCAVDPETYAALRAVNRVYGLMYRTRRGRKVRYAPRPSSRIPEWATKGQRVLCAGSRFLVVNRTAADRAFANELLRERNAR